MKINPHDRHLQEALEISDRLLDLAARGDIDCIDDSCSVLYGVMRDCAYKIRQLAESERHVHAGQACCRKRNPDV